jgi:hypothetical protein
MAPETKCQTPISSLLYTYVHPGSGAGQDTFLGILLLGLSAILPHAACAQPIAAFRKLDI